MLQSLYGLKPPLAPGPRGNLSRRFPPSDKPTGSPPLRGLKGGIQACSIENVTRTIALILAEQDSALLRSDTLLLINTGNKTKSENTAIP
jgi:hypothetical protein